MMIHTNILVVVHVRPVALVLAMNMEAPFWKAFSDNCIVEGYSTSTSFAVFGAIFVDVGVIRVFSWMLWSFS